MNQLGSLLAPLVVRTDEDRAPRPLHLMGHQVVVKALGTDTGGQFAAGRLIAQPLSGPPLHLHTREDEWFHVTKGEFWFQVGEDFVCARAGDCVFAPRGVPHTWQNFGPEVAEALGLITPAGFDDFFLSAADVLDDPEALTARLAAFGVQVLGPPLLAKPVTR